jgi:hypothetical protein
MTTLEEQIAEAIRVARSKDDWPRPNFWGRNAGKFILLDLVLFAVLIVVLVIG